MTPTSASSVRARPWKRPSRARRRRPDANGKLEALADALYHRIPACVGEEGELKLSTTELDAVLLGGAEWAAPIRNTFPTWPSGGSMGTGSYILAGVVEGEERAYSSASHGAGRAMSRHQALEQWRGRELIDELASRGILIRTRSLRGVAEEAPGAYKDVDVVAAATEKAGLARRVAFLRPKVCIKG